MDKIMVIFLAALLLLTAGGCSTEQSIIPDYSFQPQQSDMLTPAEQKALTAHARNFVSKSPRLPLNAEQKKIIRNTQPAVKVKYFGKKYGQIRMTWQVAANGQLELYGTGKMTEEDFPWRLRLSATDGSHPVPKAMRENVKKIDQ
ncbi:MAG: hypothetical protein IJW07_01075 [Lentisphaeria bacterium]|nr:hypothetical protein [Lentisphaeria bacterium]